MALICFVSLCNDIYNNAQNIKKKPTILPEKPKLYMKQRYGFTNSVNTRTATKFTSSSTAIKIHSYEPRF